MQPTGWYLGLRYMQGSGLVARVAEPINDAHKNVQFIFADRVLLGSSPLEGEEAKTWACASKSLVFAGEGSSNSQHLSPPLSTHCIEPTVKKGRYHHSRWQEILQNWWSTLATGGHLILWLPDCRYQDLQTGEAKVTLDDIAHALDQTSGWHLCEADLIDGHIYVVWQKRGDDAQLRMPWRKQPHHLLIARTGAHGDALMAASILPWLKDQGWAISFISKRPGIETLRCDPHIDELIWLADSQVPDEEMPYYWHAWEKRFDRFINLVYSVEGELLKQPGRPDYFWPAEQRRANCARSYLRYTHQLANVPGPFRVQFYPSSEEKLWAEDFVEKLRKVLSQSASAVLPPLRGELEGGSVQSERTPQPRRLRRRTSPSRGEEHKFILWCLRGSSLHKWWPYGPQAICQILAKTDLQIVLSGDAEAEQLAQEILKAVQDYHGDTKRVHNLAGKQSIREIMTLAHHASVVVGPETGVMNAVSMQPVPKVLLLSHSAPENLSNDWVNATALKPTTSCYPCHRLHYGNEWCPQDAATGAAVCAASVGADQMVDAVLKALEFNRHPREGGDPSYAASAEDESLRCRHNADGFPIAASQRRE